MGHSASGEVRRSAFLGSQRSVLGRSLAERSVLTPAVRTKEDPTGNRYDWLVKADYGFLKPSQVLEILKGEGKMRLQTIWQKERQLQDGLFVPPLDPRKLNKLVRKQAKDTAGVKWFDLPAPTITPELKKDLQLLKLRRVVDPKRHYKADDSKSLPKYFQVGTVIECPADFYSGRLTKKERKASLADELLSDSALQSYRKRKYLEIQVQKQAGGKNFWKQKKNRQKTTWART
eukprot:c15558_g1_i1 orf=203-898(-)